MVSDSELVAQLRKVLRTSDLTTTTTAIVRRKLEDHFGVDLSEKKPFIREQVDLFLQSQVENDEGGGEDGGGGEGEEQGRVKGEDDGSEDAGGANEESGGEEYEEDEDEGTSNGRSSRKKVSNKHNKDVKRRGGGFTKLCSLSPQLQNFVGVSELARTEVVKQLWAYIRENNLQDPGNKRKIICDERLHELFNVKSIDMFQMNKVLAKHIWPLASEDAGPGKSSEKEKQRKKEREEGSDELPRKEKRRKSGTSGFLAPLQLSDALTKFIGTGESALSRADVVKKMWEYIKQNNLQDPADKRRILCDEKLKELFDVDTFVGFTVPKLLAAHFSKTE